MTPLTLRSGHELKIVELHQNNIYHNLILGLPTRSYNKNCIEHALEYAKKICIDVTPYLINPIETPLSPAIMERFDSDYQYDGGISKIPNIVCIGLFYTRDHSSRLTIIWFQDDFALPIDADRLDDIRNIEWNKHASPYEL